MPGLDLPDARIRPPGQTAGAGGQEKWKDARYSDNPQFWSDPNTRPQDVVTFVDGNVNKAGAKQAFTTVKTAAIPDQIEAYNVNIYPFELVNLVHSTDPTIQATISQLDTLLHQ